MTGGELKSWRLENGYSQTQLAAALGVIPITVSRWEREEREIPPFLHLALKCLAKKGGEIRRGRPPVKREEVALRKKTEKEV